MFVTLGTIVNTESGDLLRTAALGAARCSRVERVFVATGEHLDAASLGRLPQNVSVLRFVEQEAVLAECDAVISHAGSGTVLGALKQALPSVNLPMGADQHLNADRLQTLRLGRSIRADTATVEDVRQAVTEIVESHPMRRRLESMRDEILAAPGPDQAIRAVTDLAT